MKYGDRCNYRAGHAWFTGTLVGFFCLTNGKKYYVGETDMGSIFYGPEHAFNEGSVPPVVVEGEVVIKNKEDDPSLKDPLPLAASKF